jgi:hypothetical protein
MAKSAAPILGLDSLEIRRIAVESDSDPRSVQRELRALCGVDKPVRGRAGERIRSVLRRHGVIVSSAA